MRDIMGEIAKIHVAMSEVNYDLQQWAKEIRLSKIRAWHEKGRVVHRLHGEHICVYDVETGELYGYYSRDDAEELDAAISYGT
jgi:hypothetical protein